MDVPSVTDWVSTGASILALGISVVGLTTASRTERRVKVWDARTGLEHTVLQQCRAKLVLLKSTLDVARKDQPLLLKIITKDIPLPEVPVTTTDTYLFQLEYMASLAMGVYVRLAEEVATVSHKNEKWVDTVSDLINSFAGITNSTKERLMNGKDETGDVGSYFDSRLASMQPLVDDVLILFDRRLNEILNGQE